MMKLFSLALALFSLIVAVQCGGGHSGIPACPTTPGGPQPSSHNSRSSVCVFKCPQNNVEGNDLSSSIHDSTRLNCRYTTTSTTGIQAACVYNKVRNPTFLESPLTNRIASVHRWIVEQRRSLQVPRICSLLLPSNRLSRRQEEAQRPQQPFPSSQVLPSTHQTWKE
jgi:hypothetical protein